MRPTTPLGLSRLVGVASSALAGSVGAPGKFVTSCVFSLVVALVVALPLDARAQAPTALQATVSGNLLTLSWQPPTTPPTGYLIEGGTAPGLSDIATVPVAAGTTSVSGVVPNGTYFIRLRAFFGGVLGPASNEVAVTVGSTCVAPSAPINLATTVNGSLLALNWAPPATGTAPFTYTLLAGSVSGVANLGTLALGGITSIQAPVPNGTYYFRVVAANACGVSGPSNEAVAQVGVVGTPLLTFSITPNPVPYTYFGFGCAGTTVPGKTWVYNLRMTNVGTGPFTISSFVGVVIPPGFPPIPVSHPASTFVAAFGGSTISPQASLQGLLCVVGNWENATLQWTFIDVGGSTHTAPVITFLQP